MYKTSELASSDLHSPGRNIFYLWRPTTKIGLRHAQTLTKSNGRERVEKCSLRTELTAMSAVLQRASALEGHLDRLTLLTPKTIRRHGSAAIMLWRSFTRGPHLDRRHYGQWMFSHFLLWPRSSQKWRSKSHEGSYSTTILGLDRMRHSSNLIILIAWHHPC